jgi:hypothetical protein
MLSSLRLYLLRSLPLFIGVPKQHYSSLPQPINCLLLLNGAVGGSGYEHGVSGTPPGQPLVLPNLRTDLLIVRLLCHFLAELRSLKR